MTVEAIQNDKHPVKVGLSDAYIIDKTIFCKTVNLTFGLLSYEFPFYFDLVARRKTIYEYHRVNFPNEHIENNTMIYLRAQATCLNYTDCQSCIESSDDTDFKVVLSCNIS